MVLLSGDDLVYWSVAKGELELVGVTEKVLSGVLWADDGLISVGHSVETCLVPHTGLQQQLRYKYILTVSCTGAVTG